MPDNPPGLSMDPNHPDALDPTLVIPESLTVTIEEQPEGTPLAVMLERFGGYEFTVTDMFGQQRVVSMEKWRNADHKKTRLTIGLRYKPSEKGRHTSV
jgi:hypothetical protein